jgi:hypothetical protein
MVYNCLATYENVLSLIPNCSKQKMATVNFRLRSEANKKRFY